jgi:hypothetical protein
MTECTSSLDYLRDPADVFKTMSNMVEAAREGGLVRLTSRTELPDHFYDGLNGLGLKLLTKRHVCFEMPPHLAESLGALYGDEAVKHWREKLKDGIFYILAERISREKNVAKLKVDNFKVPTEEDKKREWRENMLRAIRLVGERLAAIEGAVKNGNLAEAKNILWEFSDQGRAEAVKNGTVVPGSLDAQALVNLIRRTGSLALKIKLRKLLKKIPEK